MTIRHINIDTVGNANPIPFPKNPKRQIREPKPPAPAAIQIPGSIFNGQGGQTRDIASGESITFNLNVLAAGGYTLDLSAVIREQGNVGVSINGQKIGGVGLNQVGTRRSLPFNITLGAGPATLTLNSDFGPINLDKIEINAR